MHYITFLLENKNDTKHFIDITRQYIKISGEQIMHNGLVDVISILLSSYLWFSELKRLINVIPQSRTKYVRF